MRSKILELFEYRHLVQLISMSDIQEGDTFLEQLILLQTEIYNLDAVLESKWELTEQDFDIHWTILSSRLSGFGIAESLHEDYLSNIKTYLKHELMMRQGIAPTDIDLEEYYYYKSCDVQLIRRIILDASPKLRMITKADDWRYFDYITEINDDVIDLVEDHDSINGNGVAFQLNKYGFNETARILKGFINASVAYGKDKVTLARDNSFIKQISKWTDHVGRDTIIAVDQISSIFLLKKMNIKENKTIQLVTEAAIAHSKEIQV